MTGRSAGPVFITGLGTAAIGGFLTAALSVYELLHWVFAVPTSVESFMIMRALAVALAGVVLMLLEPAAEVAVEEVIGE